MREVLERRLGAALTRREKFIHLPDLLLVDGGKGQLGVASQALAEVGLNLPVVALAKQHEELFLPDRPAPILLPRHSRALHLIQQVRDEAHRFAVSYHRQLRDRKVRESVLDEIPGIGPRRRSALLRRFGSVAAIGRASVDDLAEVPGMNRAAAAAIVAALQAEKEENRGLLSLSCLLATWRWCSRNVVWPRAVWQSVCRLRRGRRRHVRRRRVGIAADPRSR